MQVIKAFIKYAGKGPGHILAFKLITMSAGNDADPFLAGCVSYNAVFLNGKVLANWQMYSDHISDVHFVSSPFECYCSMTFIKEVWCCWQAPRK